MRARASWGKAPGSLPAHVVGLAAAFAVMWLLHAGDHTTPVVLLVGVAVYTGIVGGWFLTASRVARRRSERERENFARFVAERNRRLYGK